jgi:hypothetical protein
MIKYALRCQNEHEFEGWFSNSAAYDAQSAARQVACPVCASDRVEKALMAPNVVSSDRRRAAPVAEAPAKPPEPHSELVAFARKLREHVAQNSEYVGPRFAQEARKIHYEETEARGIYGEASAQDVKLLKDEGIEFHPLPTLPEDHN